MTAPDGWRLPPPIDDPALDGAPVEPVWRINPDVEDWLEPEPPSSMALLRVKIASLSFAAMAGVLLGLLYDWLKGDRS